MRTLLASMLVFSVACGGGGSTPDAHVSTTHDAPNTTEDAPSTHDSTMVDGNATVDGTMVDATMVDAVQLTGIAGIRGSADGAINIPIANALVTYVAPAIGTDPAGVFVQVDPTGPAIFLALDPTTLTPAPLAGQNVSFTATMKTTVSMQPRVTAVTGWTMNSAGNALTTYIQNVSTAADLVTGVDTYDSELIQVTGTAIGAFASSGAMHVATELDTMAVTANASLLVRVPSTVATSLDLAGACVVKVGPTPLQRFNAQAEVTAWAASEVTVMSCPAPKVLTGIASTATTVLVTFDRLIDPASLMANGSQFTFDQGLTVSAAAVSGKVVTLTTSAQAALTYKLTVANTVKDTYSSGIDATALTANVVGFSMPATLLINEVNPNITGSKDLVELIATTGGSILNFKLQQDVASPTTLVTLPAITVAAGDIIVIHFTPTATTTSETTTKADCTDAACYANAWDIAGGTTGLTFSNRVLRLLTPAGAVADAVPFVKATTASPATFPADLDAIQTAAQWLPALCGGAACSYTSVPTASDATISVDWTNAGAAVTGMSVQRKAGANTKTAADWTQAANTFGAGN